MKILKVWAVVLPLFIAACSSEYTGEASETTKIDATIKKSGIAPHNTANPYDIAGSIHNEILESLENTNFNSGSIESVANAIDSVSISSPGITTLPSGNPAVSTRLAEMTAIVNSTDALSGALTASSLGESARTSLATFINTLLLGSSNPYENIHSAVVSYEAAILASTLMTNEDKRIILTTTSVIRYSASKKKRKDKDWETSVTSIAAAVSGSDECLVLALKMAATVGLCKNNNITQ
jgi:hypothetical protein